MVEPRKRILIVEDEAIIAMGQEMLVRSWGYEPMIARSAENAIQCCTHQDVDLVLMDIDLGPGRVDGATAAQRILALRNVPIIFVTSHPVAEVAELIAGVPWHGYVSKCSVDCVLRAAIESALSSRGLGVEKGSGYYRE